MAGLKASFRLWHETVMSVLSSQVRYEEEVNGPSSVVVRGPFLTQLRHRPPVRVWPMTNFPLHKVL